MGFLWVITWQAAYSCAVEIVKENLEVGSPIACLLMSLQHENKLPLQAVNSRLAFRYKQGNLHFLPTRSARDIADCSPLQKQVHEYNGQ